MKTLFVVESSTKAKSISKWLGDDYIVLASEGHICDIEVKYNLVAKKELNWDPTYILLPSGKRLISTVKKNKKLINRVILATDFDREGEVIAFNIKETLSSVLDKKATFSRLVLREITKSSVYDALNNYMVDIDMNLVMSQESRGILDKMIGYTLSFPVSRYLGGINSVGRVQTVSLNILDDRTQEHKSFVPVPVYELKVDLHDFSTKLSFGKEKIETEKYMKELLSKAPVEYFLRSEKLSQSNSQLISPLKTSTLQKACFNIYGMSPSRTMFVTQSLYEGVEIRGNTTGVITYPRTDSTRVFDAFLTSTKQYIQSKYNITEFNDLSTATKKQLNVQDAHECIRPVDMSVVPEEIKEYLSIDEYKVYFLIYYMFIASCLKGATIERKKFLYENSGFDFSLERSRIIETGYYAVPGCKQLLFNETKECVQAGEKNIVVNMVKEHITHTKPKALYSEIGLIGKLEESYIGRPSTYDTIVSKLVERKYVEKLQNRLSTTPKGSLLSRDMQKLFASVFDLHFTQRLEEKLQEIAVNKLTKEAFLDEFVSEFRLSLEQFLKYVEKTSKEGRQLNKHVCFICGSPVKLFLGAYGAYVQCEKKHNSSVELDVSFSALFHNDSEDVVLKLKARAMQKLFIMSELNKEYYFSRGPKGYNIIERSNGVINKLDEEKLLQLRERMSDIEIVPEWCSYIVW